MAGLASEIHGVLDTFDKRTDVFSEAQVYDSIRPLLGNGNDKLANAEGAAFQLCEDCQDRKTGWGTYFGPLSVWKSSDGTWYESPSLKSVDADVIAYWEARARQSQHPVLRARYADAVWELGPKATGRKQCVENAWIAIDAYVDIAGRTAEPDFNEAVDRLRRALDLAIGVGDKDRISKVRDAVLMLQRRVGGDDGDRVWSFSYEVLVDRKGVPLTEDQLAWVIAGLEKSLSMAKATARDGSGIPLSAENTATQLAEYYRRHSKTDDVRRVMADCAEVFIMLAKRVAPMLGSVWLGQISDLANRFGCTDVGEKIAVVLRDLGAKSMDQMVEFSRSVEIPKEEIDKATDQILTGSLEDATGRAAVYTDGCG